MQSNSCPPTHQIVPITLSPSQSTYSLARSDGVASTVCLTCILASLQPAAPSRFPALPPPSLSLTEIQQSTVAILTGLTQLCPSDVDNNEVLRLWVLETLDPSIQTPAGGPESDSAPNHYSIGSVLVDIVALLFRQLTLTPMTAATTTAHGHSSNDDVSRGGSGSRTAFTELVVFLFACWELLLSPAEVLPQPTRSCQGRDYVSPMLLGDQVSSLDASYGPHGLHMVYAVANNEDELCLSPAHSAAVLQAIHVLMGRLVDSVMLHQQPCSRYAAVSLLLALVHESSLFKQALMTSGQVCALVQLALPAYIDACACRPPVPARRHSKEREGETANALASGCAPSDALYVLLQLLFTLFFERREDDAAAAVAAATTCGASFLSSLMRLLTAAVALTPPLLSLVLVALREVLAWPATRIHLLPLSNASATLVTSPPSLAQQPPLWEGEDDVEEERQALAVEGEHVAPGFTRGDEAGGPAMEFTPTPTPLPADLAVTVCPLLLCPRDEVVRLACEVLMQLLHSPFTEDTNVASASRAAVVAVARHVEGYALHAVDIAAAAEECKRALCGTLVGLVDFVATILEAEEEERAEDVRTMSALSPTALAGVVAAQMAEEEQAEDVSKHWRVVFHLSRIDATLFEQLVCGAFFRRAARLQSRRGGAFSRDVEWNSVVAYAVNGLLDAPTPTATTTAPTLSLFAYLCFLRSLATGMGAAVQTIWSNNLARLMNHLTERVEACVAMASGSGSVDVTTLHLHCLLEPRTHLLLIHVTAAYLTFTGAVLNSVALRILCDLVYSPGLASARCSHCVGFSDFHAGTASREQAEAEEECRCLLHIATELLSRHNELLQSLPRTRTEVSCDSESGGGACCCCCSHVSGAQAGNAEGLAPLHELCAPGTGTRAHSSLFDVLLSLCPESANLVGARVRFIEAIKGDLPRPSSPDADAEAEEVLADNPLAFVSVSTVQELIQSGHADHTPALLLGLSDWSVVPFAEEGVLASFLTEVLLQLVDEVSDAEQRMSGARSVASFTETSEHASYYYYLHDVGNETTPSSQARIEEGKVLRALLRLLSIIIVYLRWNGPLPSLPRSILLAPRTGGGDAAVATQSERRAEGADHGKDYTDSDHGRRFLSGEAQRRIFILQPLMLFVEESHTVRRGVCHFLLDVASHHRVDLRHLLASLQSQHDRSRSLDTGECLTLFPGLGAAVMLSALLHFSEMSAAGRRTNDPSHDNCCAVLQDVVSSHWLTEVFAAATDDAAPRQEIHATTTSVCLNDVDDDLAASAAAFFPGQLLLTSLFRRAHASKAAGNASMKLRESTAQSEDSRGEEEARLAVEGLRYVLLEARYQMGLLQRLQRSREPEAPTQTTAARAWTPGTSRRFFRCLLSAHITPFLSISLRTAGTAMAEACTDVLLRLACVSLWFLTSIDSSACDAVLTQFALRHVRLCLGLTKAEVERSYAAESKGDEAEEVDGVNEGGGDNGDVERRKRATATTADLPGLPRRTLLVLQLLYLLLQRSNRVAVAAADTEAIFLFAATARHASANAAAPVCIEVHVMAAIVQLSMCRLRRRSRAVCNHEDAGNAGVTGTRWYEYIDLTAFQTQAPQYTTSVGYRKRVWLLLAGMECAMRLSDRRAFPTGFLRATPVLGSSDVAQRPRDRCVDNGDIEWPIVHLLLTWCYHILVSFSTTSVFTLVSELGSTAISAPKTSTATPTNAAVLVREEATSVMVVAARLLFMLLHRFPYGVMLTCVMNSFLLVYCTGTAAVSDPEASSHVVAEGWVLAALLDVLDYSPHWSLYAHSVEMRAVRFLQLSEVASLLRRSQMAPDPPSNARVSAIPTTRDSSFERAAADSTPQNHELHVVVLTLVDVIRRYERVVKSRGGRFPTPDAPLLPIGTQVVPAPRAEDAHSTRWWTPYTIPAASSSSNSVDSLPLMLVFSQLLY